MKNGSSFPDFCLLLSLFIGHLSLVICCLTENPWQVAKDFGFSSTDLCASVFIGGFT